MGRMGRRGEERMTKLIRESKEIDDAFTGRHN